MLRTDTSPIPSESKQLFPSVDLFFFLVMLLTGKPTKNKQANKQTKNQTALTALYLVTGLDEDSLCLVRSNTRVLRAVFPLCLG